MNIDILEDLQLTKAFIDVFQLNHLIPAFTKNYFQSSTRASMRRKMTSMTKTVILIMTMPKTTVSVWKNSLPFMIMNPNPSRAATSSAEMTQVHDNPKMILNPLIIWAMLAGKITSRMTCILEAPRFLAA